MRLSSISRILSSYSSSPPVTKAPKIEENPLPKDAVKIAPSLQDSANEAKEPVKVTDNFKNLYLSVRAGTYKMPSNKEIALSIERNLFG
jgi:hypothetical protein